MLANHMHIWTSMYVDCVYWYCLTWASRFCQTEYCFYVKIKPWHCYTVRWQENLSQASKWAFCWQFSPAVGMSLKPKLNILYMKTWNDSLIESWSNDYKILTNITVVQYQDKVWCLAQHGLKQIKVVFSLGEVYR